MAILARRSFLHAIASATALVACVPFGMAEAPAAEAAAPPAGRRIALNGYDPVSYFTAGSPEKGSDEFWFAFDDAVYLFRSAEHRAMFAADPERYAPQYDGFCAAGISKGYKTEPDPEVWLIANGKLYVLSLRERLPEFKRDTAAFVDKADFNWPVVRTGPIR
jgi:hypothetical protein